MHSFDAIVQYICEHYKFKPVNDQSPPTYVHRWDHWFELKKYKQIKSIGLIQLHNIARSSYASLYVYDLEPHTFAFGNYDKIHAVNYNDPEAIAQLDQYLTENTYLF